ncbi:PLP-dependent lyase/thiolase [Patescibacteria group bacterium]
MGIWQFKKYLKPNVKKLFQLSLDEGSTPCVQCSKLAKLLKLEKLYLKREDINPTGSFKDRSLAYQLSAHLQEGKDKFVISSSGNAAISAISYSKLFKSTLDVFVAKNIPADKLMRLLDTAEITEFNHSILQADTPQLIEKNNLTIHFSKRAKSDSIKYARQNNSVLLRGSNDDLATVGFKTISYELIEQAKDADSIFIPCSSGTSTVGIYQGYNDMKQSSIPIHIVQTTKIHPMASQFDKKFKKTEMSLSSAISDRVALRKDQVLQIVVRSGGGGWVISDDEIMSTQAFYKLYCNIITSFDSSLALAGLIKALTNKVSVKKPVLILSGK